MVAAQPTVALRPAVEGAWPMRALVSTWLVPMKTRHLLVRVVGFVGQAARSHVPTQALAIDAVQAIGHDADGVRSWPMPGGKPGFFSLFAFA